MRSEYTCTYRQFVCIHCACLCIDITTKCRFAELFEVVIGFDFTSAYGTTKIIHKMFTDDLQLNDTLTFSFRAKYVLARCLEVIERSIRKQEKQMTLCEPKL